MADQQSPKPNPAAFPKLQPVDYVYMIAGPLAFFIIVVFGMRAVIGPIPAPSAVQRIKEGEVKPGMQFGSVLRTLGKPKEIDTKADGSLTVIYVRTVADPDLTLEEGVVEVGPDGKVVSTRIERPLPTAQPGAAAP